ncbi:GNAT family N-acetyltransferase [Halorussus halophilus]|uniref:GNAT family N-acetyltransferase n=1 Tax=Halorussus halophilus TaxID=2650975 RepID=UPI0017877D2E|nr:GNAT family N-acetyltransferase [Halorussus halophilus]
MSITVTLADSDILSDWNEKLTDSPQSNVFHRREVLSLLETTADARLHHLVGYNGDEPMGFLPIFETDRPPLKLVATSPKDLTGGLVLGPVLFNFENLKQRKAERYRHEFVEGCYEWIDENVAPDVTDVRTNNRFSDVRPFQWRGSDLTKNHTYIIDLTPGWEETMEGFDKETRRLIRNTNIDDDAITQGGPAEIRTVIEQVAERFEEHGETYGIDPSFVVSLCERLPDEQVFPYVFRDDGEILGGLIAFEFGDTVYAWEGTARTDTDVPVNTLLYGHVMKEGIGRGRTRCNITTADNQRLCRYKSKYGPSPEPYHVFHDYNSPMAKVGLKSYERLPEAYRAPVERLSAIARFL